MTWNDALRRTIFTRFLFCLNLLFEQQKRIWWFVHFLAKIKKKTEFLQEFRLHHFKISFILRNPQNVIVHIWFRFIYNSVKQYHLISENLRPIKNIEKSIGLQYYEKIDPKMF